MKLVGHRGAKDEWPENTLLGMRKAIEEGVFALEVDVHLSKDNKSFSPSTIHLSSSTTSISSLFIIYPCILISKQAPPSVDGL